MIDIHAEMLVYGDKSAHVKAGGVEFEKNKSVRHQRRECESVRFLDERKPISRIDDAQQGLLEQRFGVN